MMLQTHAHVRAQALRQGARPVKRFVRASATGANGDKLDPKKGQDGPSVMKFMQDLVNVPDRAAMAKTMNKFDQDQIMGKLLANNRSWSQARRTEDPEFFERLCAQQFPEHLWIGCADSRVPANVIMGLAPGEVFVQRNVGNQALHADLNAMACLEYSVSVLKVKSVIVCGHYGCGAVKAALTMPPATTAPLMVNYWIRGIRDTRNEHFAELEGLDADAQLDRLCELNVLRQVFHVCTSPVVQAAWEAGQELSVYGVVYRLKDGLLKPLVGPFNAQDDCKSKSVVDSKVHGPSTEVGLKTAVRGTK